MDSPLSCVHVEIFLGVLVVVEDGAQSGDENDEGDHGQEDHEHGVDFLAGVSAQVQFVEAQVDRVFRHDVLGTALRSMVVHSCE